MMKSLKSPKYSTDAPLFESDGSICYPLPVVDSLMPKLYPAM